MLSSLSVVVMPRLRVHGNAVVLQRHAACAGYVVLMTGLAQRLRHAHAHVHTVRRLDAPSHPHAPPHPHASVCVLPAATAAMAAECALRCQPPLGLMAA